MQGNIICTLKRPKTCQHIGSGQHIECFVNVSGGSRISEPFEHFVKIFTFSWADNVFWFIKILEKNWQGFHAKNEREYVRISRSIEITKKMRPGDFLDDYSHQRKLIDKLKICWIFSLKFFEILEPSDCSWMFEISGPGRGIFGPSRLDPGEFWTQVDYFGVLN